MSKKLSKILALIIATTFTVTLFSGFQMSSKKAASEAYYDMYNKVKDSSDFPTWTGEQLKLKAWYAHGTGDAKRNTSDKDVVNPEIKRVTGIEIDKDTSFDNGGQAIDVKLGMLNAANDWPDIAFVTSSGMGNLKDMINAGKVYDLTDVLKKYAPNLQKRLSFKTFPEAKKFVSNSDPNGPVYAFPMQLGDPDKSLKVIDPKFVSPNSKNSLDNGGTMFIRDDILKMLYPKAKTQNEIEALYVKQGGFKASDIFDIPVKTKADVIKLLYDVQKLIKTKNLKENGKPLLTTYAFGGQDNWFALACLSSFMDRRIGTNYFTYFDNTTKKIEFMWQKPFFKQDVKEFSKMVRDGVMDKNSLLENNASHLQKLNNGQYAVAYLYDTPDQTKLSAAGKKFRYRTVWLDSPHQTNKFISTAAPTNANIGAMIFKDKVKEADLPQVVRYLDYLMSEVGEKMYTWGPKSAGLFTEKNGKRVFKDPDLADAMVYGKDNGKSLSYNLMNTRINSLGSYGNAWPYYMSYMWGGSNVAPVYAYDKKKTAADGASFFNPGNLPGMDINEHNFNVAINQNIWDFFGSVPSVDAFWKGRDSFEKALTKTLAAKDDKQFEQLWKSFQDIATKVGGNSKMQKDINDYFLKGNASYLPKIK